MKKDVGLAYHEAGHAVVTRGLGLNVPYVTIFPVADDAKASTLSQSAVWLARGHDQATQVIACEKDAKVNLAGPLAQHKYCPVRNVKKARARGWSGDIANAESAVVRIVLLKAGIDLGDDPTAITLTEQQLDSCNDLMDQLWEASAALVEDNWPAIERVAEALLLRPILNQDDIDALIANLGNRARYRGEVSRFGTKRAFRGPDLLTVTTTEKSKCLSRTQR
jgi:hypothetical protein